MITPSMPFSSCACFNSIFPIQNEIHVVIGASQGAYFPSVLMKQMHPRCFLISLHRFTLYLVTTRRPLNA